MKYSKNECRWRMGHEMIKISAKLILLLSFTKIAGRPGTRKKTTIVHVGGF